MSFTERTEILWGKSGSQKLAGSTVALFGLGGVGAAAAMDLVRAGVGRLIVTDFDQVQETNLNRLIFGFANTIGKNKVAVLKELATGINPAIVIDTAAEFMRGNAIEEHLPLDADFYIDAIDSLNPKINLIIQLLNHKKRFVSSMGMGGRIDPTRIKIGNIWETSGCPLAYMVRKRLRKRGIEQPFDVVFSDEPAVEPVENSQQNHDNMGRIRKTQGSSPFVPQSAGHIIAYYAVKSLLNI